MNAKQFEELLGRMCGLTGSEADQRTRTLRVSGAVPYGPRGRHAPDITPMHAAFMVLSLVSRRAVDAAEVAHRAANLQSVGGPLKDGMPFASVLAFLLSRVDDGLARRVTVSEDGSVAWVTLEIGGRTSEMLFAEETAIREMHATGADPAAYGQSYVGRRFVVGGGSLMQMGLKLAQDVESGWHDAPELDHDLDKLLVSA